MNTKRRKVIALCLFFSGILVLWPKSVRDAIFTSVRAPFTLLRQISRILIDLPNLPELSEENSHLREALVRNQLEVAQLHAVAKNRTSLPESR